MMKITEFKKLEKRINSYNFNQSYKSVNKIMGILSYFGHIASIFLAFFFMSKILSTAMSDYPIAIVVNSLIILGGLELLKRDIFNKFSIQTLKDKAIKMAIMPLLITSLLLSSASFYSTINGAKEFSSRATEIQIETEQNIDNYRDSIIGIYEPRIVELERRNLELFESNLALDQEASELPPTWVTSRNNIRSRIDANNERIDINDRNIENLKIERDVIITEYSESITGRSEVRKEDNLRSSLIFIVISIIIELVILCGIYFNEYYKYRSYVEMRDKIERDPNYQKWLLYDDMISVLITEHTKVNGRLPSNKAIIELCRVNDILVLPKDVTNFLKVLSGLNIIKTSGSVRYFNKNREMALEIIRKHFKID